MNMKENHTYHTSRRYFLNQILIFFTASSLKTDNSNGISEKKTLSSKNLARKMSSILVGEPSKK